MKIRVYKDMFGDWVFLCLVHPDEMLWTYSWQSAYEAAMGHLCMHKH
jgi:hypothetical protein